MPGCLVEGETSGYATSEDGVAGLKQRRTYTGYSIGCAVTWALIWIVVGTQAGEDKRHEVRLALFGWWAGWTSATIARAVYPPPRRSSR
jgi:hypothetical protein